MDITIFQMEPHLTVGPKNVTKDEEIGWLTKEDTNMAIHNAEYDSFRSTIPLQKITIDDKMWTIFDGGPKAATCPLVCLPPASGGADVYFRQMLNLCSLGYRMISVDFPPFWSTDTFCNGFRKLLIHLGLGKVHLFGASLGGYLIQKFCEKFGREHVASLILCNTFTRTDIFERAEAAKFYWMVPNLLMKRFVLGGFPKEKLETEIAQSVDFMVERLDQLRQDQLASRLTLNCAKSFCDTSRISSLRIPVTIIDVYDSSALSSSAKDCLLRAYPWAKKASLKSGGNFPYISRSGEVNTHIRIHLQQFDATFLSCAVEESVL